jgi:hypothetical protein
MSLDDKLDSELVISVEKCLDTTLALAKSIIENRYSYPDEFYSNARGYQKEFNRAVWLQQPSPELRDGFKFLAKLLVAKTTSPKNGVYNFMKASAVGCVLYGFLEESSAPVLFGIMGFTAACVMQFLNNLSEKVNFARQAQDVYGASDDYWKAALTDLHERRNHDV